MHDDRKSAPSVTVASFRLARLTSRIAQLFRVVPFLSGLQMMMWAAS
jgi:hypothetical protein